MSNNFEGGAYKILHEPTGSFYFGCTNNFTIRERDHRYHLGFGDHSNKELQQLFNKSPVISFEYYPTVDRAEAGALEELFIHENRNDPLIVNGQLAGYAPPSANLDWVERMRLKNTGRDVSSETREKMSKASILRGVSSKCRELSIEARRKSVVVDGVIYESVTAAGAAHGLDKQGASRRVKSASQKYANWNFVTLVEVGQ